MRTGTGLLLGFACLISAPASAAEKFFSIWSVEPSTITSEVLLLNENDFLQKTRLLPPGLAELDREVVWGKSGQWKIGIGEQLFELAGGNGFQVKPTQSTVFCQVKPASAESKGFLTTTRFEVRSCLLDNEKDGKFDGVFAVTTCFPDFPILTTKIPKPKDLTPLGGVGYRRLDPREIKDGPTVGIIYTGIALLDGDPRFAQAFGSGNVIPLFGEKHSKAAENPGQRKSFGATFTILAKEGKSIRLRNDTPIPSQPFSMFSSGSCF